MKVLGAFLPIFMGLSRAWTLVAPPQEKRLRAVADTSHSATILP